MVCGNTLLMCIKAGFLVRWVSTVYNAPFHRNMETMTTKLNEKMINNKEPITDVIIKANRDMGNPIITARLRMFL
jgi:hypothetical protein